MGKDGKIGPVGPPGDDGKKGPKGDSCKSELQVHLNALKSYVDMKFDVLKGMVDKTMTRTADSGVVKDLGEDNDASEKMDPSSSSWPQASLSSPRLKSSLHVQK